MTMNLDAKIVEKFIYRKMSVEIHFDGKVYLPIVTVEPEPENYDGKFFTRNHFGSEVSGLSNAMVGGIELVEHLINEENLVGKF